MEKFITIFGSFEAGEDSEEYRAAYKIGYRLAKKGYVIKNGGGSGIMSASTRGAVDAGGKAVGIVIKKFYKDQFAGHNREIIICGTLFERLEKLILGSSGFVVFSGSTGTLAELSLVWELINKGFIKKYPVVCFGNYWKELVEIIGKGPFDRTGRAAGIIEFSQDVDRIIEILTNFRE